MKKLLLFMTIAMLSFGMTSCKSEKTISAKIMFTVESDCGTIENMNKIKSILTAKELPIGLTEISVEGESKNDIDIRVKQILADFIIKVTDKELNDLNTGATFVIYSAAYDGFSTPIAISQKTLI